MLIHRFRWPAMLAAALFLFSPLVADATTTQWPIDVLHAFAGPDGSAPVSGVVADANGTLYGTTTQGGKCSGSCGTVFKLTPPHAGQTRWTTTVIYYFPAQLSAAGNFPSSPLFVDAQGALYGATLYGGYFGGVCIAAGCGVVYKLTPPTRGTLWTQTVLHRFSYTDGALPNGTLVADAHGALYGTTVNGGTANANDTWGAGTVYRLNPPARPGDGWGFNVIHTFGSPPDGAFGFQSGNTGLVAWGNTVFGTTPGGGAYGGGAVFELAAGPGGRWRYTIIHSFDEDGSPPDGLIANSHGVLFGTTQYGGPGYYGTVFALTPPIAPGTGWTSNVIWAFSGQDVAGGSPLAGVIADAHGNLYGTTRFGAQFGWGAVFELTPPAAGQTVWSETLLRSFGYYSYTPSGLIADARGNLYGTLATNDKTDLGTVYELRHP